MTTAPRVTIDTLEAAQHIAGVYAVQNLQLGTTKAGKPFLKMLIADKTGRTPGRMWSTTEEQFRSLPTDGFVYLEGQTQPYQGEMQIIVHQIREHVPTERELMELLPATAHDVDEMFGDVLRLLQSIQHPALKCLVDRYLEDGELMQRFCQAPAAQTLHHAYLGGLLEHTLSLMTLADKMVEHYPHLSRDIVLMGLFLHDLGKCHELTWMEGFGYSTDGQLVGHIGRGAVLLNEKCKACEDPELGDAAVVIPAELRMVLEHIIFSHHGVPEYGALKLPATPEAIFISNLDNLDAKMNMALDAAGRDKQGKGDLGGDFTEKIWALGTRLYRPDPSRLEA
ncbi:MAG: 3'-5' exoribonuclease YhaM family protein [Phycisphaerales bacterium JB063]